MYDMTPLNPLEVSGPRRREFLQQLTTNNVDKRIGSVTYTLMLDETGGIRSDLTVARLATDRSRSAPTAPLDLDWLAASCPTAGVPSATSPAARAASGCGARRPRPGAAAVPPTTSRTRRSKYFRAQQDVLGAVPVTMMRVSYVGELGWEIYTTADHGPKLWDLLWEAGRAARRHRRRARAPSTACGWRRATAPGAPT